MSVAEPTVEPPPDEARTDAPLPRRSPAEKVGLWVLAFLLAAAAMIYQRATGPTHPLSGSLTVGRNTDRYSLPRSWDTGVRVESQSGETEIVPGNAEVAFPYFPTTGMTAELHHRRYRTGEEFAVRPMVRELGEGGSDFRGALPHQPAAGKVEYFLTLRSNEGVRRVPERGTVVLRYKDPVPAAVLLPHVLCMIGVILLGARTVLGCLFDPRGVRPLTWAAFGLMTVGGLVLGPVVQKYAFGDYWTGFPWGGDWTDNKMLVMWGAWLIACVTVGFSGRVGWGKRLTVLAAAAVMIGAYLVPHSMGGSELDYAAVDSGEDPAAAVTTGRR